MIIKKSNSFIRRNNNDLMYTSVLLFDDVFMDNTHMALSEMLSK